MKKLHRLLFLTLITTLTGCGDIGSILPSETSSTEIPTESSSPSTSDIISSEDPSSEPSSEVPVTPLDDPDMVGYERSEAWPTAALNTYLTYDENITMPELTSEADFHHGLYDGEWGIFYHVLTRVRTSDGLNYYINQLTNNYSFNLIDSENGLHYLKSSYDDVRLHMTVEREGNQFIVLFEFFDGEGDDYTGPVAVDNVATFDLRTKDALESVTKTRGKWEVRPATFLVYSLNSGYDVGNSEAEHISNPLRFYAGQQATFKVAEQYKIVKITILASSGYADRTAENMDLSNGTIAYDGDWVTITPVGNVDTIDYKRHQVMDVGQVRWLRVLIEFTNK